MKTPTYPTSLVTLAFILVCSCATAKGSPDDRGGSQYVPLETAATTSAEESARSRSTHAVQTVFVIVMENHSFDEILGNRDAPFINDVMLYEGAHA